MILISAYGTRTLDGHCLHGHRYEVASKLYLTKADPTPVKESSKRLIMKSPFDQSTQTAVTGLTWLCTAHQIQHEAIHS